MLIFVRVCGPFSLVKGAVLMAKTSSNVKHSVTVRTSGVKTALVVAKHSGRHLGRACASLVKGGRLRFVTSLGRSRTMSGLISSLPDVGKIILTLNVKS